MVGCGGDKNKSQPAAKSSDQPSTGLTIPETFEPIPEVRPPEEPEAPATELTEPGQSQQLAGFRRDDDRVVQNMERLSGSPIKRYESKRLILYTDIDPKIAEQLPLLADALYAQLETFFGKLPANKAGTEFQSTGYLMRDQKLFRTLGLLTDRVPPFENGRHMGYEFWANDQQTDYYRRHLVLHEFTHCFMACVTGTNDAPPAWYMEGMAEYFGTHRLTKQGPQFGIMPENKDDYKGLGRITFLNRARSAGKVRSLADVMSLKAEEPTLYPWSWGACWFLTTQPDLAFRNIGTHHTLRSFQNKLAGVVQSDANLLEARWRDFVHQLEDGYDGSRAAIQTKPGSDLAAGETKTITVAADHGWQSTGIALQPDAAYEVTAAGRFQVDDQPRAWISEPNGVSVQYVQGERLGCVQAAVYAPANRNSFLNPIKIGKGTELTKRSGTLYLRINDAMNSLANNAGTVQVTVRRK